MLTILTKIILSEQGKLNKLSLNDLEYYVKEWSAHNMIYNYLISEEKLNSLLDEKYYELVNSTKHVDLNTNDWRKFAFMYLGGWYNS